MKCLIFTDEDDYFTELDEIGADFWFETDDHYNPPLTTYNLEIMTNSGTTIANVFLNQQDERHFYGTHIQDTVTAL